MLNVHGCRYWGKGYSCMYENVHCHNEVQTGEFLGEDTHYSAV